MYNTEELLESLEPYESRKFTDKDVVKRMCDLEARFYKSKEETERENSIIKNMKRKRHNEARSNKEEAAKLYRLNVELSRSKELIDVPIISE